MDTIYILGSGSPYPAPHVDRFGSAFVVGHNEEYLMFDCGPAATWKMAKMGISPTQIDNLFFTHHHSDHDIDYPCFLTVRWDMGVGKVNDLHAYGPHYTEQLTTRLLDPDIGAYAHDGMVRTNHPLSLHSFKLRGGIPLATMGQDGTNFREHPSKMVIAKDIGPGKVCEGKDWEVISAPAEHVQPYLDSLAYRLNTSEGSVVFTGDTRPCETVTKLSSGADVMVISCVGIQSELDGFAGGEGQYMCGTTGAGKMAQEAGVKTLVLAHNAAIASHGPMERAIADVKSVYDGEVIFGEELMEINMGPDIGRESYHAQTLLNSPTRLVTRANRL